MSKFRKSRDAGSGTKKITGKKSRKSRVIKPNPEEEKGVENKPGVTESDEADNFNQEIGKREDASSL